MIEKIPPHSREAEISVLGASLLSNEALVDVIEIVKPEDFYDAAHKEIFATMREMFKENKPVDIVTVCDELKKRQSLDVAGGRGYIVTLSSDVPSTKNAGDYAKIVAERASLRKLISTAEGIREKCFEGEMEPATILDYAEKGIFEIAQSRQKHDYTPIKEILLQNVAMIDEAVKNKGQVGGIPTGFKELDDKLNGLHKSDLIIVAARPAMGKTAFALNIAENAAIKGNASVLIFSLEMPAEQIGQRLLTMEARVKAESLQRGTIERGDWDRINVALDTLSKAKISIDDTPGVSILEMKNKCRRMKAENGLDLIIIDYLQLMRTEGRSESRQQEVSELSRYLKLMAREMDCPVIVLSQLSRAPEARQDRRPMLSDLRESGSIEQDADIVLMLYRDDYYNQETEKQGICEINVAKHRNGDIGTVELTWVKNYTKFSDKA